LSAQVLKNLDGQIEKLQQVRQLLADPIVLRVVKAAITGAGSTDSDPIVASEPVGARHPHRSASKRPKGLVSAARQCIEKMGYEPFSKRDLAQRLYHVGFRIKKPKTELSYPITKLMAEGVIELAQRAGRGNKYRRTQITHAEPNNDPAPLNAGTSSPAAPLQAMKFQSALLRTAVQCAEQFDQPFDQWELLREMRKAHTFVADEERSLAPALRKLVNNGFLDIVREENGGQPALFMRKGVK
jgi:hypothetical protein